MTNQEVAEEIFKKVPSTFKRVGDVFTLKGDSSVTLTFYVNLGKFCLQNKDKSTFLGFLNNPSNVKALEFMLQGYFPFTDYAKEINKTVAQTLITGYVDSLPLKATYQGKTMYLISEETYKYFTSKCFKYEEVDACVVKD